MATKQDLSRLEGNSPKDLTWRTTGPSRRHEQVHMRLDTIEPGMSLALEHVEGELSRPAKPLFILGKDRPEF
jgi:hypothetical protein